MTREQAVVGAESVDRRQGIDGYRHRIAERDVVARVVALGVRQHHVAAAGLERIDDLVVLEPACAPRRGRRAEHADTADDHRPRASHAATSLRSCGEPCFDSTQAPQRIARGRAAIQPERKCDAPPRRLVLRVLQTRAETRRDSRIVDTRERRGRGIPAHRIGQAIEQDLLCGAVSGGQPADREQRGGGDGLAIGRFAQHAERGQRNRARARRPARRRARPPVPRVRS